MKSRDYFRGTSTTCTNILGSHFIGKMRNCQWNYYDGNESERDRQIVRKKTRWKLPWASVDGYLLILTVVFCLTAAVVPIDANSTQYMSNVHCIFDSPHGNLSHIRCSVSAGENLTISRNLALQMSSNSSLKFRHSQKARKFAIEIVCENMSSPSRFNFTELGDNILYLESLNITGCNFTRAGLIGAIPSNLTSLKLTNNYLENLPEELFERGEENKEFRLQFVDLSNNFNLTTLPKSFLNLTSVQSLKMSNNSFGCIWVSTNLYPWYEINPEVIVDATELNCRSKIYPSLTIYGALKAKYDEKRECQKVDKRCSCNIYTIQPTQNLQRDNYPPSFTNHGENVSITLKVDCSGMNLTTLPRISPLTRHLNVSHNLITHLDQLKEPEYANLGTLVAEYNQIENIDVVEHTPFVKQFYGLGLKKNNIKSISTHLVSVLLSSDVNGLGRVSLEENYLECTCDTYYMKLVLAKHHSKIQDMKKIFCRNFHNAKVHELQFDKVCPPEGEDNLRWYVIIAVEVFLIVLVMLKVWHDSRQYRQTGILPWCSAKMPRLPCDFMLEGIKERHTNGR